MTINRASLAVSLAAGSWAGASPAQAGCETTSVPTVTVIVDMDAAAPGIQSSVIVAAGAPLASGIAIFVYEPTFQSCIYGVGYLGGIDRGIAFGHVPGASAGAVTELDATAGTPLHPGNFTSIFGSPRIDPGFAGPEVQYIEGGAETSVVLPGAPDEPILVIDVLLEDTEPGDVFDFHLLDFVTVWTGGAGGAFSTQGFLSLDSGGDAVPDQTESIYGTDPDVSIPVPPASFLVDYVDGGAGGGPATIVIVPPGDVDGDGTIGTADLLALLAAWGPCPGAPGPCPADLDFDGAVGTADLLTLLANWGL